jgi:hypothetical protein
MKRLIALAFAVALCLPLSGARAWWQSIQQVGVGGATYIGPGNVVSGATAWYGLRAYSTATAGNRAINLCDNTGANCADISTNATTGKLNAPGTLGSNNCNTSGTCHIHTWYDQSGALACGGSACDVTQATVADQPTLNFSCINSLPCVNFPTAVQVMGSAATLASFTSGTYSAVSSRTGAFTTAGIMMSIGANGGGNVQLNYRQAANTVQMFMGTAAITVANITDSNFHAFQAVFNGASSDLFCGGSAGTSCSTAGTSNSISPGTTPSGTNSLICIGEVATTGTCTGGSQLTGEISEIGVWSGTVFTGTQQTNMNANQYTFWGPF